ncbi:MAG: hypothetical protein V8T00_07700 [Oscillospiraceae bacterium]
MPDLVVAEPDYALYVASSRRLMALLREVSPVVEQYSIDEAWVDMTGTTGLYGPPVLAAQHLKDRIFRTLGFTVNIGVSCNKLLAKMAGELEKPNKVITLFPQELSGSSGRCRSESFSWSGARQRRSFTRWVSARSETLPRRIPRF